MFSCATRFDQKIPCTGRVRNEVSSTQTMRVTNEENCSLWNEIFAIWLTIIHMVVLPTFLLELPCSKFGQIWDRAGPRFSPVTDTGLARTGRRSGPGPGRALGPSITIQGRPKFVNRIFSDSPETWYLPSRTPSSSPPGQLSDSGSPLAARRPGHKRASDSNRCGPCGPASAARRLLYASAAPWGRNVI